MLIENLRALVDFHEIESKHWRQLYQEQRGGQAYNDLQTEVMILRKKVRELEN